MAKKLAGKIPDIEPDKKKHKYSAKPTVVDGIRFASKREAKRYGELKLLEKLGEIEDLELQPKFVLEVNGILICTYVGDFSYFDKSSEQEIVEDAKGVKTPEYRLKKKLMKAVWDIEILEV